MRVSDSAKVLFVHVQKTGGSTIDVVFDDEVTDSRRVLRRNGTPLPRHSTYARLLRAEPELADYWSFGFVRNPWSRMVSWYSMYHHLFERRDAGAQDVIDRFAAQPDVWLPFEPYAYDFGEFVFGAPSIPRVGRTQVEMLTRADGSLVDFVGRTESFAHDLGVVRERLGLPPAQAHPHRNKSSHGHYSDYYTPETRAHVAEVYAADVEAFGYAFETAGEASGG